MLRSPELFETAIRPEYVQIIHDHLGVGLKLLIAVALDELTQLGNAGCIRILQTVAAAFLPVFDQIEAHLTGPTDSTFHKAEIAVSYTHLRAHETPEHLV